MAFDFNHAVTLLLVYDIPTAVAFYRDVLGFEVINTSKPFNDAKDNYGWAMLLKNNVYLMLNNMYEDNLRPLHPDPVRAHHHRDTTIYIWCPDTDEAYAFLQAKGIAANPPFNTYYGMRQVQVFDPDGYSIVFQQPLDPTT